MCENYFQYPMIYFKLFGLHIVFSALYKSNNFRQFTIYGHYISQITSDMVNNGAYN